VQSYTFATKKKANIFRVDPDRKILCRVTGDEPVTPVSYFLSQNYPNPFNPTTTITYQIYRTSDVQLKIYNTLGQEIRNYSFTNQKDGKYKIVFDSFGLSSGTYFYKLIASDIQSGEVLFTDSKTMQFVK
jgi:hypothetical protein